MVAVPYPWPKKIHFDGQMYPKVQQGAYWAGFRLRFIPGVGADPEPTSQPKAEIRTAPIKRNGILVATMRTSSEPGNWWRFDLPSAVTDTMLTGTLLYYDVDLTDMGAEIRRPIEGRMDVAPRVTSGE